MDGITTDGVYAASGHMRTKTPHMRKNATARATKHDRVPAADRHKPGPGYYDHNVQSLSSTIFKRAIHLNKTRQVTGFGSDSRKVFCSKSFTPGPGAYVAPSAFGVYVGEKALLAQQEATNSAKAKSVIRLYNNGYEDVKTMINNTF